MIEGVYPIIYVGAEDEGDRALGIANAVLAEGASVLQLRAKGTSDALALTLARALARACRNAGALLIVNDRVDIAHLAGAHGVHLGADDLPTQAARQILGPDAIIGRSVDTVAEARSVAREAIQYIAWGSVYPSPTKADAALQSGPEALLEIRATLDNSIPLVAIGGIEANNIGEVAASGADAAAVISAIRNAADPGLAFRALSEAFARAKRAKREHERR